TVIGRSGDKPDGLTARDRLAAVLVARHDVAGAQALLSDVLKGNPRDSDALTLRADMALDAGDAPAAIADLRAVLRDQPTSVELMRELARAYERNHEPDLAEEMLRNAVQTAPKDEPSRLELAQVLTASNRTDEAAGMLEQLAKENPMNVAIQESLFRV